MSRARNSAGMLLLILAAPPLFAEDFLLTFDEYRSVENRAITTAEFTNEIFNKIPERTPEHRVEVVARVGQPFRVRVLEGNREIVLSGVLRRVEQDMASVEFQQQRMILPEKPVLPDGVTRAPKDLTGSRSTITGALDTPIRVAGMVASSTDANGSRTEITTQTIAVRRWMPPEGE